MILAALVLAAAAQEPGAIAVREVPSPAGPGTGMPSFSAGGDGVLRLAWLALEGERVELRFAARVADGWTGTRAVAGGTDWLANWADVPALAAHEDGTLLATWLEVLGRGTHAYGARFALSADGGASWSAPAWLHEDRSPVEHGFVSLLPRAQGFLALWLDGRAMASAGGHGAGATRVYARSIARDGALGPELLVDERACDCCPTHLAPLAGDQGDGALAVWRDRDAEEVRDVAFARLAIAPDGPRRDAPRLVHADGWRIPGCPVNGPRLARGDGRTAAVWTTGAGGGAFRVLASDLEREGGFGRPRVVDDGAPAGRVDAVVHEGELIVLWLEVEEGRGTWRLRAIPPAGPPSASAIVAEVSSDRASGHARLAVDGDGILVAWTDDAERRVRVARVVRER